MNNVKFSIQDKNILRLHIYSWKIVHSDGLDKSVVKDNTKDTPIFIIIQNVHILKYSATVCKPQLPLSLTSESTRIRISDSPAIVKHKSSLCTIM